MELLDYNLKFIYFKGSNNILVNAISRLKTLDIYRDQLQDPKPSNTMKYVTEVVTTNIQALSIDKLHNEQ